MTEFVILFAQRKMIIRSFLYNLSKYNTWIMKTLGCNKAIANNINEHLDLPEFVKLKMETNLIPYFRAIDVDGYETPKSEKNDDYR